MQAGKQVVPAEKGACEQRLCPTSRLEERPLSSSASRITKGASRDGMKPTESSGSRTLAPLGPDHTTVPTTSAPSSKEEVSAVAGAAGADGAAAEGAAPRCRRGTRT